MHWNDGLLRSYLSESLEKGERNMIADHLPGCARCSSRLKTIEDRIQFIEPLLVGSAANVEVTDRELAVAWWRLKQRIDSESVRRDGAVIALWWRRPRWVLIVVSIIALATALLGVPLVRDTIRRIWDAVRSSPAAERLEQVPSSDSTLNTAGKSAARQTPEPSVAAPVQGRPVQSAASARDFIQVFPQEPSLAYLPGNDPSLLRFKVGFEPGTGCRIRGRVSTEEGEPIPGATVSLYGSS